MEAPQTTKETLHLFREGESGDAYAARDLAHAKELFKADTGQDPDEDTDWSAVADDKSITVHDDDVSTQKETKTALAWANESADPGRRFGNEF